MTDLVADLPSLAVVAAILLALFVESRRRIAKSIRRQHELATAMDLLRQHRDALAEFVGDDRAPQDLRAELLLFSDVVGDRHRAERLARQICDRDGVVSHEDRRAAQALRKRIDKLRTNYPDLADAFGATVTSGIGAMLFRHPETAQVFRSFVTRTMMDARNEAALFAKVVGDQRTNDLAGQRLPPDALMA